MPSRKTLYTLLISFVLVGVLFVLLILPWPGVLTGYRKVVAGVSNIFLCRIGDGRMNFELMDSPTLDKDTTVHVQNIATGSKAKMSVNARRTYLHVAFAVSLILAAPIPWRRKLVALALGLVLIGAYVQFGFWLKIVHLLSEPKFGAMQLGEATRKFLMLLIKLSMSPVLPYIVALVVAVLVTIRREDVVRLAGGPATQRTTKP